MIPIWFCLLTILVTAGGGVTSGYFIGRARRDGNRRRAISVFDAYNDNELKKQRIEIASKARWRAAQNHYKLPESLKYLRQIDEEIERREKEKLVIESTKADDTRRELETFDRVYGHILRGTEQKEIN